MEKAVILIDGGYQKNNGAPHPKGWGLEQPLVFRMFKDR
jgi:hypothetical protein